MKKVTPSGSIVMVYDASSRLVAEYADMAPAGPGGTQYATADHLGTPRLWTNQQGAVISRHDYLPFGEELFSGIGSRSGALSYPPSAQTDGQRNQFTSKERDTETGLDYFLARYYSSAYGQFTSSDEFTGGPDDLFDFADDASSNPTFYADLNNPQSLNKYQYSYHNPLRYVDPNGHDPAEPPPDPQGPVAIPIAPPIPTIGPPPPGALPTAKDNENIIKGLQQASEQFFNTTQPFRDATGITRVRIALGVDPVPALNTPPIPLASPAPVGMARPIDKPSRLLKNSAQTEVYATSAPQVVEKWHRLQSVAVSLKNNMEFFSSLLETKGIERAKIMISIPE